MPLDFERGQSDGRFASSVVQIRDYPITMACWFKVESHPATQETALMAVSTQGTAFGPNFFMLGLYDLLGGDDSVSGFVNDGGTVDVYSASGTVPTGSWKHAAATWTNQTTRKVFYGGTADDDTGDGTSFDPQGENRFSLGYVRYNGNNDFFFDGLMAHATIWRAVLSDDEINALAAGLHPMLVRPTLQWGSYPNTDPWTGVSVASVDDPWSFTSHSNGSFGLPPTLEDDSAIGDPSGSTDYGPSQVFGFVGPM